MGEAGEKIGPYYIDPETRIHTRETVFHPPINAKGKSTMKEQDLTCSELVQKLLEVGHEFQRNLNLRKPQLVTLCKDKNIDTKKKVKSVLKKGWAGSPKGIKQVLWETGWIDPSQKSKYKMAINPKKDKDKDGNLTEESKRFNIGYLLKHRPDFQEEISDLESLVANLSCDGCVITILFSPKYHPEIA